MISAVSYVRCSTDNQDVHSQKNKIEDFAAKNDYVIDHWFIDKSISGSEELRPQLIALKAWVETHQNGVVIMVGVDRLARDAYIFAKYNQLFENYGIKAVYINSPTIGEPAVDTLMQSILAAFASYEKNLIRGRFEAGRNVMLKNNSFSGGGKAAYGYQYVKNQSDKIGLNPKIECVINPKEAEIVQLVFYLYGDKEMSKNGICDLLTQKKVPCRGLDHSGTGTNWSITTLTRMLRNKTYIGEWNFGKTQVKKIAGKNKQIKRDNPLYQLTSPPLVDKILFDRVQNRLNIRGQKWSIGASRRGNFLLTGLLICGKCGLRYAAVSRNVYAYYRCGSVCHRKNPNGTRGCGNRVYKSYEIEQVVLKDLESVMKNPTMFNQRIDQEIKNLKQQTGNQISELEPLTKKRDKLKVSLDRILDLFLEGDFDKQTLKTKKREYESQIKALNEQIDKLSSTVKTIDRLEQIKKTFSKTKWRARLEKDLVEAIKDNIDSHKLEKDKVANKEFYDELAPPIRKILSLYVKSIIAYDDKIEIKYSIPMADKTIVTNKRDGEIPTISDNFELTFTLTVPNIKPKNYGSVVDTYYSQPRQFLHLT